MITEIMFNPNGDENAREFIEVMNRATVAISFEGYRVGDGTGFDDVLTVDSDEWTIPPGGYALILDPDYFTAGEPYDDIPDDCILFTIPDKALGSRGLSNSTPETVSLITVEGDTLSAVTYNLDCPPGFSWERVLPEGGDNPDNFMVSRHEGGTPGRANSVLPPAVNPSLDEHSINIVSSEARMGDSVEITVSYRNSGTDPLTNVPVQFTLLPGSEAGNVSFSEKLPPGEYAGAIAHTLVNIPGGHLGIRAAISSVDFTFTQDDTVYFDLQVPVPPGTIRLNEVMADPPEGDTEWIEIINTGSHRVDLYGFHIMDIGGSVSDPVETHYLLAPSELIVLADATLEPGRYDYRTITVDRFPALNNSGDALFLHDSGGNVIDSMSYDSAPDGLSLELITPDNEPLWDVCVDRAGSTPGRQNSIYFQTASIVEDDDDGQVRITIEPNPFDRETRVSYNLPFPLARVRVLVYDRRGRHVATIRDTEESGSMWSGTWEGRKDGRRLPAGPYILDVEILDKQTGNIYRERKTIVVAARL
ncbi:lamin tail domain-containing protein [Candidatus Latescibacterota bacterium]